MQQSGRRRHADLGLRARLQFQPRAGADRRRHRQRSVDAATARPTSRNFLTENLERIEVVRGPMCTMYGGQAIGGVINMVTKARQGPMNGAAFTELGTRMRSNSGAYVRGSEGRFNYNLTFAGTFTPNDTPVPARFTPNGGYVDIDPYRNITLRGAARLRDQRQHPVQLVRPLHRHQAELRPGRAGRSQRQRLHVAVLHSRRTRRLVLRRPLEARRRRQLQHDHPARPRLRQPAGTRSRSPPIPGSTAAACRPISRTW